MCKDVQADAGHEGCVCVMTNARSRRVYKPVCVPLCSLGAALRDVNAPNSYLIDSFPAVRLLTMLNKGRFHTK